MIRWTGLAPWEFEFGLWQVLLSSRLLVLNDKNKRKFAQNGMIPFVLSLLKVTPVPSRYF